METRPVVEIALLGPLECRIDEAAVPVSSRKQRAILAILGLHAPGIVSSDQLMAALWGEGPPPSARNSLEAHISRLRKLLAERGAPDQALRTQAPGYALDARTDLQLFERLRSAGVARAAAGVHDEAVEALTAALELWRGEALADLVDEPFAPPEIARLDEQRLATCEELIRCQLALGREQTVIAGLDTLVAEHPLREGLSELLMLALYRTGRQADALALYRKTGRRLQDELGLNPGPSLRALESAILRHDPALRPVGPEAGSAVLPLPDDPPLAGPRPSPTRQHRRPVWALIAVAAAAVTAAGVSLGLASRSGARSLSRPRPLGARLLASIPIPLPSCCAFGFGGVWIVGHHDGNVSKIDPSTNRIVASYHIAGFQALNPLIAAGSLWIPAGGEDRFVRFDPARARVVATFPIEASQIAWGYNSIWVTTRDHQLVRIDLRTNRIASHLRLLPGYNDFDDGIAIGFGSIWISAADTATVLRIDPATNRVAGEITGFGDTYSWMPITTGDGSVWTYRITGSQGVLYRIDPFTNRIIKRIAVGPRGVAWPNGDILDAGGYVWTCDGGSTLSQIDPRSNRVVGWYTLPETCQELAYGDGDIWTALYDNSRVLRIAAGP